jgi:DNA invertase Pin-like site-specific DNA recombinase
MPAANKFVLHIMAAVAAHEAKAISKRTKADLQAAKERGTVLGGRRVSAKRFAEIGSQAHEMRSQKAVGFATRLMPVIEEARANGAATLRDIAEELNRRNIDTRRGGQWSAVQVSRVLAHAS